MNPNRIWAIGTVLVIGAVLGLGWLLGVSPLLAQTADAATQRAGIEQSNVAQEAVLAQMKADYSHLDELQNQLAVEKLSIPSEVDSDAIYAYLAGIQAGGLAPIDSITTGEAQLYGGAGAENAPASDTATPTAGVATIDGLYTVPVTVTFTKEATAAQILGFAWAMQNGPRLFVVSSIARSTSSGSKVESTATITASMFVMSDPDSTPGSSAGVYEDLILQQPLPEFKPWPASKDGTGATPNPTGTPTPGATPTPTPTPTGGATATPTPTP
ncbi:MAG: hypothetical protein ABI435_09750 [Pseudolysinimonas sp.]